MIVKALLKGKPPGGVVTTTADQRVGDAARLLHEKKIGALVVLDAAGEIAGILSERDIVRGMALHGNAALDLQIDDLMTSAVLVCSPSDSVESLMAIMTNRRVRHLPVVEEGQLTGIVTIGDLVKSRLAEATMEVDQLRDYVMTAR